MICHSHHKHLCQRLLPVITSFLSLKDESSTIVSAVIFAHALGKQERWEMVSVHTRLPCSYMNLGTLQMTSLLTSPRIHCFSHL